MPRRPWILTVSAILAAVPAAASAAQRPSPKQRSAICPNVAYQRAADGSFWTHPVVYHRQGNRLRVRFRFLDGAGREAYIVKHFRITRGHVKLAAVREGRLRSGDVTTYVRRCRPAAAPPAPRRSSHHPKGGRLPRSFVWALPGGRPPAPAVSAGTDPAPVGATSGAVEPAPPPAPWLGNDALPNPGPSWTVLTAGDVANCFNDVPGKPSEGQHPGAGAIATTALITSALPVDDLIVPGDLVYESGTAAEFRDCYEPTWGQFKAFTHPAPGNHEYRSKGAAPYYAYWGARAGEAGKGYYSYDLGSWHIISLNTETDNKASGQQAAWLRADLAAHSNRCTLAFWHRPRWSNDPIHGDSPWLDGLYRILYEAGVDVLVQAHAHAYQRWSEMAPDGAVQPGRGIRTFVVGTGGAESFSVLPIRPGEEVSQGEIFGVLRLQLTEADYSWEFLPTGGHPFRDSGRTSCH